MSECATSARHRAHRRGCGRHPQPAGARASRAGGGRGPPALAATPTRPPPRPRRRPHAAGATRASVRHPPHGRAVPHHRAGWRPCRRGRRHRGRVHVPLPDAPLLRAPPCTPHQRAPPPLRSRLHSQYVRVGCGTRNELGHRRRQEQLQRAERAVPPARGGRVALRDAALEPLVHDKLDDRLGGAPVARAEALVKGAHPLLP